MLAAVNANGSSLRLASLELRRNKEICFAAVREDKEALFSCDLTVPWADALVCAVIGKKWTQPSETRKIGHLQGVKAYAEGILGFARGFELLCLHFRQAGEGIKRSRKAVRLDEDCLRVVRSFLPKGKLYQEAEYALCALQQLEAAEAAEAAMAERHRAEKLTRLAKSLA